MLTAAALLSTTLALAGSPRVFAAGFLMFDEGVVLNHPTQIVFGPDGDLYVALQHGEILAMDYGWDGVRTSPRVIASGVGETLLGIGFGADGTLYASSNNCVDDSGFLERLRDTNLDGIYEIRDRFVTQLPNRGHHNNQIAIDGQIMYVGMGSRDDDGTTDETNPVPAASLLRVDLDNVVFEKPNNLPEVFALGFRNPFGIAVDAHGRVWAGDNGRDSPLLPDELHLVIPGAHHGFPDELAPKNAVPPVLTLGLGTSADGLDFYPASGWWEIEFHGNIFMARFDFELDDQLGEGMDVVRIILSDPKSSPPVAQYSVFASGFLHPLDVQIDPFGNVLIMEYGALDANTGRLFRIVRDVQQGDADLDGDKDLLDYQTFFVCAQGPANAPGPSTLSAACLQLFDFNIDDRVDLRDFAVFQLIMDPFQ